MILLPKPAYEGYDWKWFGVNAVLESRLFVIFGSKIAELVYVVKEWIPTIENSKYNGTPRPQKLIWLTRFYLQVSHQYWGKTQKSNHTFLQHVYYSITLPPLLSVRAGWWEKAINACLPLHVLAESFLAFCLLPRSQVVPRFVGEISLNKQHPPKSVPHMVGRNASRFLSTPVHKLHIQTTWIYLFTC